MSLRTGDEQAREQLGAATRWRPGTSGNPGGRPKAIRDVVELARQLTPEAIRTLSTVMKTSRSDSARVAAAQVILDRGWGKPVQAVNLGPAVSETHPSVIVLETSVPRPVRPTEKPPPLSLRAGTTKEPTPPLTRPPSFPVGDTGQERDLGFS